MVMYNQIPLESSRVITSDTTHGAAMLGYSDGAKVLAAIAAGPVTMTFFSDAAVSAQPIMSVCIAATLVVTSLGINLC